MMAISYPIAKWYITFLVSGHEPPIDIPVAMRFTFLVVSGLNSVDCFCLEIGLGAIQVLRNVFFWIFDANNIDSYIFVTLFPRKSDTLPTPTALRNTGMDPCIKLGTL